MYITARERQILEKLLSTEGEITVKDLASEIDVSVRTIHRDLKGVEDILKEYDLRLIKKSGVGIHILGDDEHIDQLKMFLFNLIHNEYSPEERQTIIACSLLEASEPVKLVALANDLNVTIATVSNDLNKVEEQLMNYNNLSLVRKRGYGVEITGDEVAKRKAMSSIISEHVDEFDLLSLIRENIQKKSTLQKDSVSERLLGLVDKRNLLIVEKVVEEMNKELPYSIADSAYMGLVVHLALAMERIVRGENISIDHEYLARLENTAEFKIAEKIIEKLQQAFQTQIPKAEVGYITMHLRGAKLRHDSEYLIEDTSLQIALKAKSLIDFVERRTGRALTDNHSLLQGLVAHLSPAIFRIKQNMGITNPLLAKIKSDYKELYSIVRDGVQTIFSDLQVPEEEVGYLVLHFGAVLLSNNEKGSIKALVVCSSGIGTSKMLATRLKKEVPSIKEVRNVSLFELHQMNRSEYDLILSTVRIPNIDQKYILVDPFLPEDEVKKIKAYIAGYRQSLLANKEKSQDDMVIETLSTKEKTISRVSQIKEYSETILTILNGFELITVEEKRNLEAILQNLCESLYQHNVLTNSEDVVKALLKREELGGLGIPSTRFALYHTRSEAVLKPSFTIVALDHSLKMSAMDQSHIEVDSVLVMLSPTTVSNEALEVLSQISAVIIENEFSILRFESKDETKIASHLASKLDTFLYEKINEIRSE
ncbi:BglG family transcription antiterminator [Halalkalibacter krulwichiae]|uniref:BglG family transcription antiterminator n=1 Tax=Halalkalibacter krulwichiae TaxID=199441 RepID=UPI0008243976|nr:BglG family transcription antiterminator [Halalkalibacter krulwichiae]